MRATEWLSGGQAGQPHWLSRVADGVAFPLDSWTNAVGNRPHPSDISIRSISCVDFINQGQVALVGGSLEVFSFDNFCNTVNLFYSPRVFLGKIFVTWQRVRVPVVLQVFGCGHCNARATLDKESCVITPMFVYHD